MKFGPDDKFWVCVDPTPVSELGDVLYQSSLRELELQFKGGLTIEENPTLFTDAKEAEVEAKRRMHLVNAWEAIAENLQDGTDKIEILDRDGIVLFSADLKNGNHGQ